MTVVELVLRSHTFRVQRLLLITKCRTFQTNESLLAECYRVRSDVSVSVFRIFVAAIDGATPKIAGENISGLRLLCDEFGFIDLLRRLSTVRTDCVQPQPTPPKQPQPTPPKQPDPKPIRHLSRPRRFVPPDGIITFLLNLCGGNLHDRGIVTVTSSPSYHERLYPAKNIVGVGANSVFWSKYRSSAIPHTRNNWICYDFKARKVAPTHYSIRSIHFGWADDPNLRSWLVETSNDATVWKEIDRQEGTLELKGQNVTKTFETVNDDPCRFVRLVNIGRNHAGNDSLAISRFDIFGSLIE
jgi:hypothetical protein